MSENRIEVDGRTLKKLEYALFPGRGGGCDAEAHDRLYTTWRNFWGEFYRTVKSDESLRADDFTRADVVSGLFYNGEVVGLHLYSFFDLDFASNREHSYFRSWGDVELARLTKRGARRLMSMEFFTVNPDWRKSRIGLSLAEVLVGCGLRILERSRADAALGIARKDVKVPDIGRRYGFTTITADVERHHCPVDLIACFRGDIQPHPSPEVREYVDYYWDRRKDATGITTAAPALETVKGGTSHERR